jgi:hypothetical protein
LTELFLSPNQFLPQLSLEMQSVVRVAYGALLLGTLVLALPQARRFFMSERWGGYAKSEFATNLVQNPLSMPVILGLWMACAVLLVMGRWTVFAAGLNLLFAHYYFVRMRWRSVVRGMGAPGLMSYWLAAAIFLLECTTRFAPSLRPLALLVAQADFAFIILSAGVYKFTAGYPRNEGMELGMVNPEWGYWWRFFSKLPPSHWVFRILNHLAWGTEVVAALMMLVPATRLLGGLLIVLSFAFIATQIRLGLLCEMVMVCGLLYAHPGSFVDEIATRLVPAVTVPSQTVPAVATLFQIFLWSYLVLLPLAHAGMYFNFYARKRLPAPIQWALERYTNFFGMIIWRVFSVDVVNFFINIYRENPSTGQRALVTRWGSPLRPRYNHVCESITVTTLFTTLKYYPSNSDLFQERLLRYSRTVPTPGEALVFEYVSVTKGGDRFGYHSVAEYRVDPARTSIEELIKDSSVSVHAAHAASPVHEGAVPGSYAPLAS